MRITARPVLRRHRGRPSSPFADSTRIYIWSRFAAFSAARSSWVNDAREVDRVLACTPYVQLAGRHEREVALTFDDGPGPYRRAILSVLTRMHAPATFS